jgi:ribose transport system permease protein
MSPATASPTRLAPEVERPWMRGVTRVAVLAAVCLLMAVLTRSEEHGFIFLNVNNLLNIVRNASILIIIGVGQTITLTAKDVDLSIGSVLSLTSVVAAILLNRYAIDFPVAILTALIIGALLGLVNGLLITSVGLPPFIATYGMLWVLFGFAYLILQGAVIYGFPAGFRMIGNGKPASPCRSS